MLGCPAEMVVEALKLLEVRVRAEFKYKVHIMN